MKTRSKPTFSLVFVTYNPGTDIEKAIESVLSQSYSDYEIVVVDNASEDGAIDRIKERFLPNAALRIIENDENHGFAGGTEIGAEASNGTYIVCFNQDTTLFPGYLETLSNYVHENAVWTTARRNHRVSRETPTVRLLSPFQFTIPYEVEGLSGRAKVNFVPGDGVVVPRRIYEEVLGETIFDSDLPLRAHDLDLSLRLSEADVDMYAVLDVMSDHPDKENLYAPTVENLLNLLQAVQARQLAHRKNGRWMATILSFVSVLTTPLVFYSHPVPRSSDEFLKRTTVE